MLENIYEKYIILFQLQKLLLGLRMTAILWWKETP